MKGEVRTATLARQDTVERDKLLQQYMPLVRFVLGRLVVTLPRTLDREDLLSAGVFGLMHAAAAFDPARAAEVVDRGVGDEQFGERDPVPAIDRVPVAGEQLMDHHDVGGVEHDLTVRVPGIAGAADEARVNLK